MLSTSELDKATPMKKTPITRFSKMKTGTRRPVKAWHGDNEIGCDPFTEPPNLEHNTGSATEPQDGVG
jgi:hypothetical protein